MKTLIVVDIQNGFLNSDEYIRLSKKIEKYINEATYDKVIFTKYINNLLKNSLYKKKLNWRGMTQEKQQEIAINIPKNSIILEKFGYGLQQNDLEYIKGLNLKEVDICGIESDACVYAIALQLWDMEIYPNILISYVSENIKMKEIFIKQFGRVDERN